MATSVLAKIADEQRNNAKVPAFRVGDSIKVHVKIKEGDKERVQVFAGTVIARDGAGHTETFTVRRISYGEGVERVFPIYSPLIAEMQTMPSSSACDSSPSGPTAGQSMNSEPVCRGQR